MDDFRIKTSIKNHDDDNLIYKIVLGGPEIYLNVMINKKAVDIIIRLFFGKKNNACHITKLENVAIVKAIEELVEIMQKNFSILLNKEISATYAEVYENDLKKQFSFALTSSEQKGMISIAMTEELADIIKKQSKQPIIQKIKNIDGITLDLCAVLARREMSVIDVKSLAIGQIINFYSDDVTVLANETKVCEGKIGSIGEGRAIKVEKIMEVN